MSPTDLWHFFPLGYLLSILVETVILLVGLSSRHGWKRRLLAGVWLTACTYPIVTLVLPLVMAHYSRFFYLIAAETFAPVAECVLFYLAFRRNEPIDSSLWRDFAAIVVANLASFLLGEVFNAYNWFGWLG